MSRIGKLPIVLEEKIEARINGSKIEIKWPLGTLVFEFSSKVNVIKEEKNIVVSPKDLNDSENISGEFIDVQHIIDLFVYESEFGNKEYELFVYNFKEAFDLTVWNAYCALIGTLNEEIADTFTSLRAKIWNMEI